MFIQISELPLNDYELIEYNSRISKRSTDNFYHNFEFKAFNMLACIHSYKPIKMINKYLIIKRII